MGGLPVDRIVHWSGTSAFVDYRSLQEIGFGNSGSFQHGKHLLHAGLCFDCYQNMLVWLIIVRYVSSGLIRSYALIYFGTVSGVWNL